MHYVHSNGIIQSYSQKGCPYDNACIDSFHAILKKEEVNHVQYPDYNIAKLSMYPLIKTFCLYNLPNLYFTIKGCG